MIDRPDLHPNTLKFLKFIDELDWKKWWIDYPKEDFGQYVRRISEEQGNIEGDYPSDKAMKISEDVLSKYRKEG